MNLYIRFRIAKAYLKSRTHGRSNERVGTLRVDALDLESTARGRGALSSNFFKFSIEKGCKSWTEFDFTW